MNALLNVVMEPLPSAGNGRDTKTGNGMGEKCFAKKFPLRILIADHNYISRRSLALMLEGLGYQFESVEDGQECLDVALRDVHDLILLDLDHLPILDGAECTTRIREARIDTTIFALSSFPPEVARLQSMGAGLNGFFQTPLKLEELKQTLRMAFLSSIYAKT